MQPEVLICKDKIELARVCADHFIKQAHSSFETYGRFSVALAGGSTPEGPYKLLACDAYASRLEWNLVHIFWGDERCVPPDHAYSNYRMAREALLDHVPIPAGNIHRMQGEIIPEHAAKKYADELDAFFQQGTFDLILLGLGNDGHTASLFPDSPVLQEDEHWVQSVEHNKPPPPLVTRLTLTLPIINTASQIMFLVSGQSKSKLLQRIWAQPVQTENTLPAQHVQPLHGELLWLVDRAAAGMI